MELSPAVAAIVPLAGILASVKLGMRAATSGRVAYWGTALLTSVALGCALTVVQVLLHGCVSSSQAGTHKRRLRFLASGTLSEIHQGASMQTSSEPVSSTVDSASSPRPLRYIITRASSTILALAMAACATIDDPKVLSETKRSTPNDVPPSKIMVVFDIALERDYLPTGGLLVSAADWRDWTWGSVERSFKQWSAATGVEVTTMVHTDPVQPPILDAKGYSHVVYEKLARGTGVTGSQGHYMKYRVWTVAVTGVNSSGRPKPDALYSATYSSDGISCFGGPMYGNKDQCKKNYLKLLSSHLQHISPHWPDLAEAPSAKPAAR